MNPRYPQVALRAGSRCEYGRAPAAVFNFLFEVEHITPVAREGTDDATNLALACRACNAHKSTRTECIDPSRELLSRCSIPAKTCGSIIIRVETETAQIVGVSAEGRAMVICLEMNNLTQRSARQFWLQFGLFP